MPTETRSVGRGPAASWALALALGLAAASAVVGAAMGAEGDARPRGGPALDFHSEVVRLDVGPDSLEVQGLYRFLRRADAPPVVPMLYPYPADSLMGGARTVCLEVRTPPGPWQSAAYEELPRFPGVRWHLPTGHGDTLEVRTVYRQALRAGYARYIVTTTGRWRHPLRTARFEVLLPGGARPTYFSFPFVRQGPGAGACYLYETTDFFPESDLVVEWER